MDLERDYYAVLGVLPSVESAVLLAVYRALLKKYHPDVYQGPKAEAERRTKEIIEAYGILEDPEKRRSYDEARKQAGSSSGSYRPDENARESETAEFGTDWELVKRYHPGAEQRRAELARFSKSLALTYQIIILSEKAAADAEKIAARLELEFFRRYFGENRAVHGFVREALLAGQIDLAQEVNRAIKVLGSPADDAAARKFLARVEHHYSPRAERGEVDLSFKNYLG
jgi:DnaJ-class molecular chaperone